MRENSAFYCIDEGYNMTIFGDSSSDHRSLGVELIPCQSNEALNKTCSKTQEEMVDYLGPSRLVLFYNSVRFD